MAAPVPTVKTILLPIDPDGDAAGVLSTAIALAAPMGATLHLLHVVPLPPSIHPDVLLRPAAHAATTARLREAREAIVPVLRALARPAIDAGIPVRLQVAHGDPADAILTAANPDHVDLIVMGTHARRGLVRAVMGSVATQVILEARVPVTTVRVGVRADAHPLSFHDIELD